jgi:hypothetical protein
MLIFLSLWKDYEINQRIHICQTPIGESFQLVVYRTYYTVFDGDD